MPQQWSPPQGKKRTSLARKVLGGGSSVGAKVSAAPKYGQARKATAAGSKPIPSQIDTIIRGPKGAEMPGWFRTLTGMVAPLPLTPATNMAANKLETGEWNPGAAWQQTKQQAAGTSGMDLFNPAEMPPFWRGKKVDTAHLWRGVRSANTPTHVPRHGYQVTATENPFVAASYGMKLEPVTVRGVVRELEPNFRRPAGESFDYNKFDNTAKSLNRGEVLRVNDVIDPGSYAYQLGNVYGGDSTWESLARGQHQQWATRSSVIPGHRGQRTVGFMPAPKEFLEFLREQQGKLGGGTVDDRAVRLTGAQQKQVNAAVRESARKSRGVRYTLEDFAKKALQPEDLNHYEVVQQFANVFESLGALPAKGKDGMRVLFGDHGQVAIAQTRRLSSAMKAIPQNQRAAFQRAVLQHAGLDMSGDLNRWQRRLLSEFDPDKLDFVNDNPLGALEFDISNVYGYGASQLSLAANTRGVEQIPKELQRNFIGPLAPTDIENTTMVPYHVIGKKAMDPAAEATAYAKLGEVFKAKPGSKANPLPDPNFMSGVTKDGKATVYLSSEGVNIAQKAFPAEYTAILEKYNTKGGLDEYDAAVVELYKKAVGTKAGSSAPGDVTDAAWAKAQGGASGITGLTTSALNDAKLLSPYGGLEVAELAQAMPHTVAKVVEAFNQKLVNYDQAADLMTALHLAKANPGGVSEYLHNLTPELKKLMTLIGMPYK